MGEYHGERLQVAFRADNGEHVWLFDDNGRYICRADWLASNRDYFPQSMRDKAKEKRIDTQLKRLADKQAIVEAARRRRCWNTPAAWIWGACGWMGRC